MCVAPVAAVYIATGAAHASPTGPISSLRTWTLGVPEQPQEGLGNVKPAAPNVQYQAAHLETADGQSARLEPIAKRHAS
jgi:hypothetical protein